MKFRSACMCLVAFSAILALAGCPPFVSSSSGGDGDDDAVPEFIGRGYDVFDAYADSNLVKATILDVSALEKAGYIEQVALEKADFRAVTGSDANEYLDNLSIDTSLSGEYQNFTGSITANFAQSRYSSDQSQFANQTYYIHKYKAQITGDTSVATLRQYATDAFLSNIDDTSVTPQKIFQMYGTHLLTSVIMGGRVEYMMSAYTSNISGSRTIGAYAKFGYKSLFAEANLDIDATISDDWSAFSAQSETTYKVYGGRSEYSANIIQSDNYDNWIESVNTNPGLCDFGTNGITFIPVWEFCDDSARKTALQSAFATWASDRQITVNQTATPTTTFTVSIKDVTCESTTEGNGGDGGIAWTLYKKSASGYTMVAQPYGSSYDDWGNNGFKAGISKTYSPTTTQTLDDAADAGLKLELLLVEWGPSGQSNRSVKNIYANYDSASGKWKYTWEDGTAVSGAPGEFYVWIDIIAQDGYKTVMKYNVSFTEG